MQMVVVTGMSGSGKTTAARALEDAGYYAVDNLPVPMIEPLVAHVEARKPPLDHLALVIDARTVLGGGPDALGRVPATLERLRQTGHQVDLLFLDTEDDVLVRRFSETRRRHPVGSDGTVRQGVESERRLLAPLRAAATRILDTSEMSVHELRRTTQVGFHGSIEGLRFRVTVMSFGFKYGVPPEADLVFDVRFLPNPFFVDSLRARTGKDPDVARYVLERDEARGFVERLHPLLEFLVPRYEQEGKAYLTLGFGCTGGRHRSVALAEATASWLEARGHDAAAQHRDVER